ncbi:hypothetical protein F4810DRAFT_684214 [Camillea tinctor]|nr:hypothetical protein F4810DRAFT_684214 [Camillea tinctor]
MQFLLTRQPSLLDNGLAPLPWKYSEIKIGILGPNKAGKTYLMNKINGISVNKYVPTHQQTTFCHYVAGIVPTKVEVVDSGWKHGDWKSLQCDAYIIVEDLKADFPQRFKQYMEKVAGYPTVLIFNMERKLPREMPRIEFPTISQLRMEAAASLAEENGWAVQGEFPVDQRMRLAVGDVVEREKMKLATKSLKLSLSYLRRIIRSIQQYLSRSQSSGSIASDEIQLC